MAFYTISGKKGRRKVKSVLRTQKGLTKSTMAKKLKKLGYTHVRVSNITRKQADSYEGKTTGGKYSGKSMGKKYYGYKIKRKYH